MFIRPPQHHPSHPPTSTIRTPIVTQRPVTLANYPNQVLMASTQTFRAEQTPCIVCPHCSQEKIRMVGWPFFTCAGKHFFYECPQCLDTRVRGKNGQTVFCGFHHAYHICPVHKTAVGGLFPMNETRPSGELVCTCKTHSKTELLLAPDLDHWDMPFF